MVARQLLGCSGCLLEFFVVTRAFLDVARVFRVVAKVFLLVAMVLLGGW